MTARSSERPPRTTIEERPLQAAPTASSSPRLAAADYAILTGFFIASRLLAYSAGVRFDGTSLERMMQHLDRDALTHELGTSVIHLHAQPPLYQLLLGLALKLAPEGWTSVVHAVHLVGGWVGLVCGATLGRSLGASRGVALSVPILFFAAPAMMLWENVALYTYLEASLVIVLALLVHRYASGLGPWASALAFGGLTAMMLLRSLFHLAWGTAVAILLIAAASKPLRRRARVATIAVVALLPAVLWYGKNAVLFGSFSSSSWLGMSLARVTVQQLAPKDRNTLIAQGVLSKLSDKTPFRSVEAYGIPVEGGTGVTVLDERQKIGGSPNYNQITYVAVSKQMLRDACATIRARPGAYARGIAAAVKRFLSSPSASLDWPSNDGFAAYASAYDHVVYGGSAFTPFVLLELGVGLAFSLTVAARARRDGQVALAVTLAFMALTLAYVVATSVLFELAENNRFQLDIDFLVLLLTALALERAVPFATERLRRQRELTAR